MVHIQKVKAFAGSEKYFMSLIPEQIKMGINAHLILVINASDKAACEEYLNFLKAKHIPFTIIPAKRDTSIFRTLRALNLLHRSIRG